MRTLTVDSGDDAAEVFILDNKYNRIAAGAGRFITFPLPAGVYAVKVRVGADCYEKPVVLLNDAAVTFDSLKFSTAAPLENTGKTHEFHISNAEIHSHQIDVTIGQGSQLFVFSRVWTGKAEGPSSPTLTSDLCTGLTLCHKDGHILVDFGSANVGKFVTGWDPWSTCNVQLDPDLYILCLKTASGKILKQTIAACSGWQTQLFFLQRDYGFEERDIRVDLENGSIFMAPLGKGFSPDAGNDPATPDFRLTELSRQGLLNSRNMISDNLIRHMAVEKFSNPMLGIYSAHLLLLKKSPDLNLLITIIDNLRKLLGTSHPDVEALALKLKLPSSYVFRIPPMLRHSWNYLLEASVQNASIVPENSLASNIAGKLWASSLWLLWSEPGQSSQEDELIVEQIRRLTELGVITEPGTSRPSPGLSPAPASYALRITRAGSLMGETQDQQTVYFEKMTQLLNIPRARLESLMQKVE